MDLAMAWRMFRMDVTGVLMMWLTQIHLILYIDWVVIAVFLAILWVAGSLTTNYRLAKMWCLRT